MTSNIVNAQLPAARVPEPLEIARRDGLDLRRDLVLPSPPDPARAGPATAG